MTFFWTESFLGDKMSVNSPFEAYSSKHNQYLGHDKLLTMRAAKGSSKERSRPPPGAARRDSSKSWVLGVGVPGEATWSLAKSKVPTKVLWAARVAITTFSPL